MVRYLSDEWLVRADAALAGMEPPALSLTVAFLVTGGPDGDRRWHVAFGPGAVRVGPDDGGAPVTLIQGWDTARAVAQGRASAQRAFLDGDIRLDGDVRALLGQQGVLAALEDRLADLRGETEF